MKQFILALTLFLSSSIFAQDIPDTIRIYFDFDSYDISARELQKINEINTSNVVVTSIIAFSDSIGPFDYNLNLSSRRSFEVNQLLKNALDAEIKIIGEAEANKANPHVSEEHRRVDIVYRNIEKKSDESPTVSEDAELLTNSLTGFLTDSTKSEVLIQSNILFYGGSVTYLPESELELVALLAFLKNNPKVTAHIRGHICCAGPMDWDDISFGRAKTVYYYLINRGIDDKRLTFKGYGTSMPFASPEITEEDQKANRRVDIVFTKTN